MDVLSVLRELATIPPAERKESLRKGLAGHLNELLLHDFAALVQLLYRVDVSEKRVKAVLQDFPDEDAGNLLAGLMIERQQEKNKQQPSAASPDIPDEERW